MAVHNESLLFSSFEDTLKKLTIPEKKIKFLILWIKRFNAFLNGVPLNKANPFFYSQKLRYRRYPVSGALLVGVRYPRPRDSSVKPYGCAAL